MFSWVYHVVLAGHSLTTQEISFHADCSSLRRSSDIDFSLVHYRLILSENGQNAYVENIRNNLLLKRWQLFQWCVEVPRLSKNRVLLFVKLLHRMYVANAWCRFGITPLRTAGQGGEFAARQNKDWQPLINYVSSAWHMQP